VGHLLAEVAAGVVGTRVGAAGDWGQGQGPRRWHVEVGRGGDFAIVLDTGVAPSFPDRRDFRLVAGDTPINPCPYIKVPLFGSACLRPIIWIGNSIGAVTPFDGASSTYVAHVDPPAVGWRAHLIEFYFNSTIPGLYFQLTTQVSTVAAYGTPLYPFPLCVGEQCRGDLV
jgi:hypothetical protein